ETLRLKLNSDEQKRVTKHYTDNVEAYQLYLKGRFENNKVTPEGMQKGIEYYNGAIALDPAYALAYGISRPVRPTSKHLGFSQRRLCQSQRGGGKSPRAR